MVTDPIADLLTRVRNANLKSLEKVDIPSSKIKIEVARILKEEGYIANYKSIEDYKQGILRIYLKYTPEGNRVIRGLKRASKPSLRQYCGYRKMPKVDGGMGIAILSTPRGIMTGRKAKELKAGGELLCYVW